MSINDQDTPMSAHSNIASDVRRKHPEPVECISIRGQSVVFIAQAFIVLTFSYVELFIRPRSREVEVAEVPASVC